MHPRIALTSLIISAGLFSTASAQVAPPPPPPAEPEPEYVPPPMPQPRATTPNRVEPKRSKVLDENLPELPYPPLWTFCGTEDPRVDDVCTFESNLHFMALRPNPTISPGMLTKIQPVIVARRARFERLVIDNIQVAEEVDGGLVQEISISDPMALQELLERVKPLSPPTNLTQELQNRGVLSKTQARFNNKIIGEYQKVYGEYLRRVDQKNSTDRFMRSMFRDSLAESMEAFNGLLHESRAAMSDAVDAVDGMPSNVRADLLALKIDSIQINPEQIRQSAETVKLAWRPLSFEQKAAFLEAVRANRDNADVPPVPVIQVEHANKRIVNIDDDRTAVHDNSKNIKNIKEGNGDQD